MRPSAGPPPTPEGRGRHESEHRWPGRRRQPPVRDHAAPRPIPDPISHQYPQPPRHAIGQQCANSSADSVRQSSVVTYAVRCAVCRRRPSDIQSRQCASAVNFVENPPACCFCRLRHAPSGPVRLSPEKSGTIVSEVTRKLRKLRVRVGGLRPSGEAARGCSPRCCRTGKPACHRIPSGTRRIWASCWKAGLLSRERPCNGA